MFTELGTFSTYLSVSVKIVSAQASVNSSYKIILSVIYRSHSLRTSYSVGVPHSYGLRYTIFLNVVARGGTVGWNRHITPDLCLATSWQHDLIYAVEKHGLLLHLLQEMGCQMKWKEFHEWKLHVAH
jgi:hypothetical protein